MFPNYSLQLLLLLIIPLLIYGNSITRNEEDLNLDYTFHEEELSDGSKLLNESTTPKSAGIEIEDSTNLNQLLPEIEGSKPIETITNNENSLSSSCSLGAEELRAKILDIMAKYMPTSLKLNPINRGFQTRLVMGEGSISVNNDFKLIEQPVCTEIDDRSKKYDFMVSFDDLAGFYDWKVYNLFGSNFSESAIITIKQLRAEFVFVEDIKGKIRLNDVKVGNVDGLNVKVNIPENITKIGFIKQMMQYVISRITTMIANRSKDSIIRNMQNILMNAIKEKASIKP